MLEQIIFFLYVNINREVWNELRSSTKAQMFGLCHMIRTSAKWNEYKTKCPCFRLEPRGVLGINGTLLPAR